MFGVLRTTWPLFLGLLFLMLGNGMQGTLLGVRGDYEGFSTGQMSLIMSAYFAGFLVSSKVAPELIRKVGHVRVFAALGSFISAILILFPTVTEVWAWIALRALMGFCFCGVYIVVESWLNDSATNETRGRSMSLYLIVQMTGVIAAQGIMNVGDPREYILFVIPSILVSISFAPILLSANPAPSFSTTKRMSLGTLFQTSPLGCVSVFLLGGVFSAIFGMASVFGTQADLSVRDISIFIAVIYTGGLLCQYPIGWFSDRMDRRLLILALAAFGAVSLLLGVFFWNNYTVLLVAGFIIGGAANPLYSLAIAYTNDHVDNDDMAAASAGLLFINGVGAIGGPLAVGWMMGLVGPGGFFLFNAVLLAVMAGYAAWRMTRRPTPVSYEAGAYVPIAPTSTTIATEATIEAGYDDFETDREAAKS